MWKSVFLPSYHSFATVEIELQKCTQILLYKYFILTYKEPCIKNYVSYLWLNLVDHCPMIIIAKPGIKKDQGWANSF